MPRRVASFDSLIALLLFSAIAAGAALSPVQNDTWWQLRAGADMVRLHRVMLSDVYSHTAYGAPWPNHEWLSQVLFYGLYAAGGLPLLMIGTATLIVSAWAIVWRLCARDARYRLLIVALCVFPASLHWGPRPHALSLLFLPLAAQLMIADLVWWLPPLFLVWANCHGGVVLGLVVLGAMCTASHVRDPQRWARSAWVLAACVVATTLTPLGTSFWTEIPRSLARIRQYPIDEWRPPALTDLPLVPFWIGAAALAAGVIRHWRALLSPETRRTRLLVAGALALLPAAVGAVRNVGPFLMLAAPALAGVVRLEFGRTRTEPRQERPFVNASVMAAVVVAMLVGIGSAYRRAIPRLRWTPLPAASLQALSRCPDNLYNRYDEGGYLIWFAPDRRVFLDGRQDPYSPRLVNEQLQVEHTGEYAATFARYEIRCAYLPTASPVAARLSAAGWLSLYRGPEWVVLAHR